MNENVVFFWKQKKGVVSTCFCQWYIAPFVVDGVEYACAEQYMMAQKALLFNDEAVAQQIMKTTNPAIMKRLGRKVKNYNEKTWAENKIAIVTKGNIGKFTDSRNKALKDYLLSTGDAMLVEASPYDTIWGIGLEAADAKKVSPDQWKGLNLLGKVLMDVRNTLRQKEQAS